MLLTINDLIPFPPVTGGSLEIDRAALGSNPPFKAEIAVSAGYTDITSIAAWDLYGWATSLGVSAFRQMLIDDFIGSWGTLTTDEKKILVRRYVWPSGTTDTELDALWTATERAQFLANATTRYLDEQPKDAGILPHTATTLKRMVTVQILHGEKSCTAIAPDWMEMGSTVGTPENEVPDLTKALGRFVADYKTSGSSCKVRFIEEKDGAADVILKTANMPNTSGVYKRDASVDTDPGAVAFRTGRNRFIIEMQLPNAGTTASLRDINLHLLRKS